MITAYIYQSGSSVNSMITIPADEDPTILSPKLIKAINENNVDQLKSLREAGVDFTKTDNKGNTVLHYAVTSNKPDTFNYLMTLPDVPKDSANRYGKTPLIECKRSNFALKLIQSGCDVNRVYAEGQTALHLASEKRWSVVCEALIDKGADVNCTDESNITPLFNACSKNDRSLIFMLLYYGADPTIRRSDGTYKGRNLIDYLIDRAESWKDILEVVWPYADSIHLDSVAKALQQPDLLNFFPEMLDCVSHVFYDEDRFDNFLRDVRSYKREWLKLVVDKFEDVIVEHVKNCNFEAFTELFHPDFYYPGLENSEILYEKESIILEIVNRVNSCDIDSLTYLLSNGKLYFDDKLNYLTNMYPLLASYGVNVRERAATEIFHKFGYCDLFKMMLHMDLKEQRTLYFISTLSRYKQFMGKMICDVNMPLKRIKYVDRFFWIANPEELKILLDYFAMPELIKYVEDKDKVYWSTKRMMLPSVPSLVELSRNVSREYIVDKFKIKKSVQFYTVLKYLPIADVHKKIISFETKLYAQ